MTLGGEINWLQAITWILIVCDVFALLVGLMMLISPRHLDQWSRLGNTWFSTRNLLRPLDTSHDADRIMLRYPRLLGGILLASAVLIVIKGSMFANAVGTVEGGRLLARFFSGVNWAAAAWETLWASMLLLILLGALVAATIGALSLWRLDILRYWSEAANRWVSLRRSGKPLEAPRYNVDNLVRATPRIWGGVITLLALYVLVTLSWFGRGA